MVERNINEIRRVFRNKGYKFFTAGIYNLNIVSVRSRNRGTTYFDDTMYVVYRDENKAWQKEVFKITTDPGIPNLLFPVNRKGTAIVVPGQYRGVWKLGFHKGIYRALVQRRSIAVYRDDNQDDKLDFDENSIDYGFFGINCHRSNASTFSTIVGRWSAGCQVFAYVKQFKRFIKLCKRSAYLWSNSFTYTLIEEKDFYDNRL